MERKLLVTASGQADEQDLDADDLARRCARLVVLGGPGSGKTWLARRTARLCAEAALDALARALASMRSSCRCTPRARGCPPRRWARASAAP